MYSRQFRATIRVTFRTPVAYRPLRYLGMTLARFSCTGGCETVSSQDNAQISLNLINKIILLHVETYLYHTG